MQRNVKTKLTLDVVGVLGGGRITSGSQESH